MHADLDERDRAKEIDRVLLGALCICYYMYATCMSDGRMYYDEQSHILHTNTRTHTQTMHEQKKKKKREHYCIRSSTFKEKLLCHIAFIDMVRFVVYTAHNICIIYVQHKECAHSPTCVCVRVYRTLPHSTLHEYD